MERCGNGAVMGSERLWNGEETVSSDNDFTKLLLTVQNIRKMDLTLPERSE